MFGQSHVIIIVVVVVVVVVVVIINTIMGAFLLRLLQRSATFTSRNHTEMIKKTLKPKQMSAKRNQKLS